MIDWQTIWMTVLGPIITAVLLATCGAFIAWLRGTYKQIKYAAKGFKSLVDWVKRHERRLERIERSLGVTVKRNERRIKRLQRKKENPDDSVSFPEGEQ